MSASSSPLARRLLALVLLLAVAFGAWHITPGFGLCSGGDLSPASYGYPAGAVMEEPPDDNEPDLGLLVAASLALSLILVSASRGLRLLGRPGFPALRPQPPQALLTP